jgi:hypothetical protein
MICHEGFLQILAAELGGWQWEQKKILLPNRLLRLKLPLVA